jgi:hypothetical protein
MQAAAGYDPRVIERYAEQLLRKSDSVRVGMAVGGGIFGTIVGSVPLTPLESVWPIPGSFGVATILLGALIGILVGYVVGEGRAFRYRVEAQRALFQLDIEKRVTAAVVSAVAEVAARQQLAPAVQPGAAAPAHAPAPVAPAPPTTPPAAVPAPPPTVAVAPPPPAITPPAVAPAPEPAPELASEPAPPPVAPAPVAPPPLRPPGAPAAAGEPELPPLSPAVSA